MRRADHANLPSIRGGAYVDRLLHRTDVCQHRGGGLITRLRARQLGLGKPSMRERQPLDARGVLRLAPQQASGNRLQIAEPRRVPVEPQQRVLRLGQQRCSRGPDRLVTRGNRVRHKGLIGE